MADDSLANAGGSPPAPGVGQSLADAFNVIAPALAGAAGSPIPGNRGRMYGAEMGMGAGAEAVQAEQERQRQVQKQQQELQIQKEEMEYKRALGAQAQAAAEHMQAETKNLGFQMQNKAVFRATLSGEDQALFDTDPKAFMKKYVADQQQPYNLALAAKMNPDIPLEYLAKVDTRELARIAEIGIKNQGKMAHEKFTDESGHEFLVFFNPSDPTAGQVKVPIEGAVKTPDKAEKAPTNRDLEEMERDWRLAHHKLTGDLTDADKKSLKAYQVSKLKDMQTVKQKVTGTKAAKVSNKPEEKPEVNVDSARVAMARKAGYGDAEIASALGVKVEDLPK